MSGSVMTEQRGAVAMAVNHDGLLEILDQVDSKHGDAHIRLRTDFRELETRLDDGLSLLRDALTAHKQKLAEVEATPLDATKLVMRPQIVASIVFVVVTIAAGMWASTSGLRSDMRDIVTQMKSDQRVADANAKLLELNTATITRALDTNTREMKDSIQAVQRRQDLQQLQIAEMKESIIRLTPVGRR